EFPYAAARDRCEILIARRARGRQCARGGNTFRGLAMSKASTSGSGLTDSLDKPARRSSIAQKYLDPATSMGEVLFGLIMTLTFTLGAGLIIEEEGREGARQLLIATIGCNIAWGIIDGALYLAGQLFD